MRLAIGLIVWLLGNIVLAEEGNDCDVSSELKKFETWINGINTYEVEIDVLVKDSKAVIESKISGITHKRLKVRLITKAKEYTATQSAWFDGKRQWIESSSPMGTQVVYLDASKTTKPERPFDTSFYLMGTGLFNGEDFPSSLKAMINVYDFNGKCKTNNELVLIGKINRKKFSDYVDQSLYSANKLRSIDQFIDAFGQVIVKLENGNHNVKEYSFGDKDNAKIVYIIKNSKINPTLEYSDFKYQLPKGIKAEDITDKIQTQ